MFAELGGRLAALVRGFGRDRAAALDPGAPAALDGGAAVALVEARCGSLEATSLGEALGLAVTGRRVAGVLEEASLQHLAAVADRCTPLVVWLPLARDHAAWHAVAGAGWIQLMAGSVQDAVDLALVAHAVAERALVPVLVGVDGPEVWEGVEDAFLPSDETIASIVGDAGASTPPTTAQRLLFGAHRDRLPRWFDPDQPLAQGGTRTAQAQAVAAVSRALLTNSGTAGVLDEVLARVAERTGRPLARCEPWQVSDADVVIVTQGAAARTARVVADRLRGGGPKVGVLEVRCLRPFPAAAVAAALADRRVIVLERLADRLDGAPPLLAEVRNALTGHRTPRSMQSATFGLGGTPLRAVDLTALCREVAANKVRAHLHLGVHAPRTSALPKREARLQELHATFGELESATLFAPDELAPDGWAIGVASRAAHVHDVVRDLADLLQGEPGQHLAGCRVGLGGGRLDLLTVAPKPLAHPHADILLVTDATLLSAAIAHLAPRGAVVVRWPGSDEALVASLPAAARAHLSALGATLAVVESADHDGMLGGALGAALERKLVTQDARKLRAARLRALGAATNAAERVAAMEGAWTTLRPVPLPDVGTPRGASAPRPSLRAAAQRARPPIASLPVFLDQVLTDGTFAIDPIHAPGVLPPLSSAFHDHRGDRAAFPRLDTDACTGCGRCWTACPDSAVGASAIDLQRLLERTAELCTRDGTRADALRPMFGKLAKAITAALAAPESPSLADAMKAVWGPFLERANPPAERRASLESAFAAVAARLAPLQAVRCAPFFAAEPAELLVLAFDPDACKGCGACAAACEAGAITMAPQVAGPQSATRWHLWEELPDTSERTVARAKDRPDVGLLAAIELSRHFGQAMAGGDTAEPGSGARLAVRSFLAVAEATLQPRLAARLAAIDALAARLGDAPLDDGHRLRQAEAAKRLAALRSDLTEGPTGLGRARLGLVVALDDETSWMAAFPDNPFVVPVQVVPAASAAEVARGVCRSSLAGAVDEARLLRWARAVVERPGEADRVAKELGGLTWAELDAQERAAALTIVLVGSTVSLDGVLLPGLARALGDPLPLRVLALDRLAARDALPLLALAGDRALVVQTSAAAGSDFVAGVAMALTHDGPALIRTHAPSPSRDGFAPAEVLQRMEAALDAHAFPLFRYDPRGPGVFGSRIALAERPGRKASAGPAAASWPVLQELAGVVTPFTERVRDEARREARAEAQVEIEAAKAAAAADVATARDRVTAELSQRVRSRLLHLAGYGGVDV